MDFPSCIKSKAVLISSSGMVWVMKSLRANSPFMYWLMMPGNSLRPFTPPNAEPRYTRPVTN